MKRPFVWQMIREAVESIDKPASYENIKKYIESKWDNVNQGTIARQIIVLSVNHDSRIHYPENNKVRITNSGSPYDFLFRISTGVVEKYDINKHGIWEIYKKSATNLAVRRFKAVPTTNSFLFAWNPDKWSWTDLDKNIVELENAGKVTQGWSCVSHKTVKSGDRAFLLRLGSEPRGIFASGYVASEPFLSKHWSGDGKDVHRVLIEFDVLLNPQKEPILTLDILNTGNLTKQHWLPQSSGISIKSEVNDELEAVWFDFLATQSKQLDINSTLRVEKGNSYTEGAANQIFQTRYERNPYARLACINHYGYSCSVCQFDFEKRFGELGKEFIHVHHLMQVSVVGQTYQVDPIVDLRPVCPNCHAMLHRQNPPLSIEELKAWLT